MARTSLFCLLFILKDKFLKVSEEEISKIEHKKSTKCGISLFKIKVKQLDLIQQDSANDFSHQATSKNYLKFVYKFLSSFTSFHSRKFISIQKKI